jgi:hypothetical protein
MLTHAVFQERHAVLMASLEQMRCDFAESLEVLSLLALLVQKCEY